MKYKLIGWVGYDDTEFPDGEIDDEIYDAIVAEIREKKYVFSGEDHQDRYDCTPLFSNGKKYCFSRRGWGGVMAAAYGYTGQYDYALYTDAFGMNPNALRYPVSPSYTEMLKLITDKE